MKNTKIVWRLKEQPTADSLRELVKDGILTKDEAREILFSQETSDGDDIKNLKEEIKFLKDLVERLSKNSRTEIIKQIEYIEKPYKRYPWWDKYDMWCQTNPLKQLSTNQSDINALYSYNSGVYAFNSIK